MTLANKVILTSFQFDYHMLLLLFQNGTCVVLLQIARYCGWADFESLDSRKLAAWIPLNFLFVLMLLTGFFSLNLLSVPMATIFKNSTNVLVTIGDYLLYGQSVSRGIVASLVIMLLGAVLAGSSDLEFNMMGYMWAVCNCVITASYVLYMPRAISDSKLNAFGRVYYNNLLSLPLVLLVDLFVYGDLFRLKENPNSVSWGATFVAIVTFSGCIGFFLSLTSFQCVN
jgi:GDP-mannose transporter